MEDRRTLLLEIARCPVVEDCLTRPGSASPCREVVLHQWEHDVPEAERSQRWQRLHHVPEPWVRHLESARLLFLSSNPSLSGRRKRGAVPPEPRREETLGPHNIDDHPSLGRAFEAVKWEWTDDQIDDRYTSAFDVWMTDDGSAELTPEGGRGATVNYWRAMKALADELFGETTIPGRDYAFSEVVHCKSRDEIGVVAAASICVPRYLSRTLALSPARVIVIVGRHARQAFRHQYAYADAGQVSSPIVIERTARRVVFVTAPSAPSGKYPKNVEGDDLESLRQWLGDASETQSSPRPS